jgi:transcriptional regulator with XRE-family HTH domain
MGKQKRKEKGLKQSELGKLLGVTGSAIGNYENDFSSPKADILYKVFDVLHCDANFLFQDEMKNSPDPAQTESEELTNAEKHLIDNLRSLNNEGQEKLLDYSDDLVASGRYIKNNQSEVRNNA